MYYEIETKVKVNDPKKTRKKIKLVANFKNKQVKKDEYYAFKKSKKGKFYPEKAFRIRKQGKDNLVNFKKWKKSLWNKNIVIKEEYEFLLKDPKTFLLLVKDLGIYKWINKTKISETYQYKKNKNLNIELNRVKKLGWFIEIEYLAKKRLEIPKAKSLIKKVLKELSIKHKDIDNIGYTKMLWGKR